TWLGVKKNTMLELNAFSTSATATPSAASPPTIHNARLVLGFKIPLLFDGAQRAAAPHPQRHDVGQDGERGHPVGHPHVELVAPHGASPRTQRVLRSRSRMMARTRASAAPIAYIQNEIAMSSMPQSIATCIDAPVSFTLEPWCSVFHHCTEK